MKLSEYTPKIVDQVIGKEKLFSGGIFSLNNGIEPTKFNVLDWRWSPSVIVDMNDLSDKHPAVEFLLKNETMKRSRWTKAFAVRELVPDGLDNNRINKWKLAKAEEGQEK